MTSHTQHTKQDQDNSERISLKETSVFFLEKLMRYFYGWLAENDETLGRIVYVLHIFVFNMIVVLIVVSHTIYPVFWFQVFVFSIVLVTWLQHVILRTCICTSLERKLIGKSAPISVDIILETLKIPVSTEARMGVTLLVSSLTVFFLGFELLARMSMNLREQFEWSLWG